MAISHHLAAVHFRVIMAGEAAEHAVTLFYDNDLDSGSGMVKEVIDNLSHARTYLMQAGNESSRLSYVESLISFYEGILEQANTAGTFPLIRGFTRKITDPSLSANLGAQVYNNQGKLLAADPFLSPLASLGF